MANPQQEGGHVRIANEIMDRLTTLTLSGREWNILMFVLRKTWGWGKKYDNIPLSQYRKSCRLNQSQVCKILKSLVSRKILLKSFDGYGFNKDYDQWVVSPVIPQYQGRYYMSPSIKADNQVVSRKILLPVSPVIPSIYNNIKTTSSKDMSELPVGSREPKKRKMKIFAKYSREYLLAVHLLDAIRKNNPSYKTPDLNSWAGEVDKMLRIDMRTPNGIDYLIHWSQTDTFWFKNILSPAKLREKFDQLIANVKADQDKKAAERKPKVKGKTAYIS